MIQTQGFKNPLRVLQVNMHLHLTKWPCTHRDIFTPFQYLPLKTYQCLRMQQPILVFSCMSKRLHLGALVGIYISQNSLVLTEICSPPPPCHLKPTNAREHGGPFGVILRVKKAALGCISRHLHLTKRSSTHRDMFNPPWYLPLKTYQCSRTRWPILAFFCMSKWLHLDVLVHIYISQNSPVLTEISSTPQSGTCH